MHHPTMRPILLLAVLLAVAVPAAAQDGEAAHPALAGAAPETVGEPAARILASLDVILKELRGYRSRLAAASAEDSLVLRLQIVDVENRFMGALEELAAAVTAAGDDAAGRELRARAAAVFTSTTPAIWEVVGELRAEIDALRAERTRIPDAGRSVHEDRIVRRMQRLDRIFAFGGAHLANMARIGQDTTAARAAFAELVSGRADELSGRLRLATRRVGELDLRLNESPDDAGAVALLQANRKNLEATVHSQEIVLGLMETLGLPSTAYRTQLLATTQDLTSGLLDVQVTATLIQKGWRNLTGWFVGQGPTWLVKVLIFVVILFVGRLVARLARALVDRALERSRVQTSKLLHRMVVNGVRNAIMALALVFALSELGISLGPLLAGFGVVGFILGFAMQDSLSNLAAGMMILVNRPYDVGDLVEVAGVFGKVEHMSMVSTGVLTLDNQKIVVPNSKIWGDVIKNVTDQRIRRVDMVFGISYSDDIPLAERVLADILAGHAKVLDDPAPMVRLHTLNESSVDFVVRPWVKTEDYWEVHWDVTRAVKMRFDEAGISIPFPQRDVHLIQQTRTPDDA